MSPMSSQITQPFIRAQIEENMKAPRYWPLYGEFTSGRWLVNSPHKTPITRKMFPFDSVIIPWDMRSSLQNLPGVSVAVLPSRPSKFRTIRLFWYRDLKIPEDLAVRRFMWIKAQNLLLVASLNKWIIHHISDGGLLSNRFLRYFSIFGSSIHFIIGWWIYMEVISVLLF